MKVKCPTCQKRGEWFAGPFGPFCSKRCKMVDLGKWFSEEHLISSPMRPGESEDVATGDSEPKSEDQDDFL